MIWRRGSGLDLKATMAILMAVSTRSRGGVDEGESSADVTTAVADGDVDSEERRSAMTCSWRRPWICELESKERWRKQVLSKWRGDERRKRGSGS